jgi:hypothetical protein
MHVVQDATAALAMVSVQTVVCADGGDDNQQRQHTSRSELNAHDCCSRGLAGG